MMECDSTDKILGFGYEEFSCFDDISLPKRMPFDYGSLDFVFMNEQAQLNHIFEKKIKAELSDGSESEEVTAIFVDDDEVIGANVRGHEPIDLVNGLSEGPDLMFDDEPIDMADGYPQPLSCSTETSSTIDETEVYVQNMNLSEPLNILRNLLEERFHVGLSDYEFWLQDSQKLELDKNLMDVVDQSVHADGMVQFHLQLKVDPSGNKKINIIDVLKPVIEEQVVDIQSPVNAAPLDEDLLETLDVNNDVIPEEKKETSVRWVVDLNFRKDQELLNIPLDPEKWEKAHVRHWLLWSVRQFNLTDINLSDWSMDGVSLCKLTREEYKKKVPNDPQGLFWTHLELLKKCKFAAVIQKDSLNKDSVNKDSEDNKVSNISDNKSSSSTSSNSNNSNSDIKHNNCIYKKKVSQKGICSINKHRSAIRVSKPRVKNKVLQLQDNNSQQCGSRIGNNGQIQLWQFLLELLTDKHYRQAIQWLGNDGEFKLLNPEMVAHLWGERKNKPTMNYEKLSRALRYYYEGDMISKVHGKRFVYKFVCDLKSLLGYSASELNVRVIEAEKKLINNKETNCLLFGTNENDYDVCN